MGSSFVILGPFHTEIKVVGIPTPTPTPGPKSGAGAEEEIRVVPLPEDEFGSYELDPITGEKNYLMFNTYAICMDFLNNEELCSGCERCCHK